MKKTLHTSVKILEKILFKNSVLRLVTEVRIWLAFKIMPPDLAHFMYLVLYKLSDKYVKMDDKKKEKISTLHIDFETNE